MASLVKILLIGDVVGRPGRRAVKELLPRLREEHESVFTVVNCENAAAGSGITPKLVAELLQTGADCLTSGDHIFRNKGVMEIIDSETRLLRPMNWSRDARGRGARVYRTADGLIVGVLNLIGRVFLDPSDCPFQAADRGIEQLRESGAGLILVDFHAEATSEKVAMGWHLDGRVTAVVGTHTHVPTADERLLPRGTACQTDLGMTGPHDGVIGREKGAVLRKFITQMPQRFDVAGGDVILHGAVITADTETGLATAIERIRVPLPT